MTKTSIIKSKNIGEGTEIGNFCVIGENVKIGKNCKIYDGAIIDGYTTIGDGTKVFSHAALGNEPQDLKYKGEKTELIIGKNNLIREFTMFSPGTSGGGGKTIIGDNNLFMAYTHIAHDCIIGNNCILANCATLGGHITIGDDVNIGGMSAIHQFVKIGDGAMLGGASALSQDIPPFCIAQGNHAVIRGLNKYRLRKLFKRDEIDEISQTYRVLFSGKAPIKELAQDLLKNAESESIKKICEFIISTKRGIPFVRGELNDDDN
ncbi:acyl-ACP--UDP-N-acetylglucosamine O-acyltransferase [Helicobacter sp. 23-1045]